MFQIVNPCNRVYTGVDQRIFLPSSELAILDYDDLVVELVNFSSLTPDILDNIYTFKLVGLFNQPYIRITPYITIQNYNKYISWQSFRDNTAIKLSLGGTLSTLSMLGVRGISGGVGADHCRHLIFLDDITILEFWWESRGVCLLHPEYAFRLGDYILFRLSIELGVATKLFEGVSTKTAGFLGIMFTLVFHKGTFIGCNTTYVHDDVSIEIKAPVQQGVVSKIALMCNDMY